MIHISLFPLCNPNLLMFVIFQVTNRKKQTNYHLFHVLSVTQDQMNDLRDKYNCLELAFTR